MFLPEEIYNKLESTLLEMIKGKIKLCGHFKYTLLVILRDIVDFAKIVFHFTDADIELFRMNTILSEK
ncbi:hypothetical protein MTR67_001983 [Solanum verrucosum]|uniref:Uncharacterized protein n=1 Tax=Solanum verrucosum TaxID=315347 RepID=A0AAF0PPJ9_SOLVR|nr:hypothetical protein MTR67_001983 [Solanum verrucosum]